MERKWQQIVIKLEKKQQTNKEKINLKNKI